MLNNKFLKKDTYVVPEQAPLIISVCVANNGEETKHARQIFRKMYFVRNGEECNLHKKVWCEGGIPLSEIGTKNGR